MKICFYSPYIPKHFGGGEKYIFDCARALKSDHEVCVAASGQVHKVSQVISSYESFLGYDLDRIQFINSPLGTKTNFFKKLWWTKQFDVLYYLTDGSLFFSLAKKNILHIQVPLQLNKTSLIERLKLKNWVVKNTNSFFTKKVVEKSWPVKIDLVHQPMVDLEELRVANLKTKKNVILNIGRFFPHLHSKKQDVLVDMFIQLANKHSHLKKDWSLVLIGGVEDQTYLQKIRRKIKGHSIKLFHDLDRSQVVKWLKMSSLYWHATGFGVDETEHPELMEHFGISTVEAMAAGCVPIVINKGGQPEILGGNLKSLLWNTPQECLDKTWQVIDQPKKRLDLQAQAQQRAQNFSKKEFDFKLKQMIGV